MILTIHQPEHLPWIGFFNKMASAEKYVILDNVQFRKNYFQNRNQVLGTNGKQWVAVPVELSGHSEGKICDIRVANKSNPKWKEKYLKTLRYSYCRHPYFNEVYPFFEDLFSRDYELLVDINLKIIFFFCDMLGINPCFVRASELLSTGLKSDLILNICKEMNATTYVAGPSGRDYLHLNDFDEAGIKVVYNDFAHTEYRQKNHGEFTPYLSVLDLLMNVSAEEAKDIVYGKCYWAEK